MGAMLGPWGAAAGAVAGGVMGGISANNARQVAKGNENARRNAQDDLIIQDRARATHDYLREVRLEQLQATQEQEALTERANDIAHTVADAKSTTLASAAERGVAGRSLDSILADFDFQQNQEVGRLRINQSMKDQQHVENTGGYADQFTARATSEQRYIPKTQPATDYFMPIFGLVGNLAQATKGVGNITGGAGKTSDITPKDYGSLTK